MSLFKEFKEAKVNKNIDKAITLGETIVASNYPSGIKRDIERCLGELRASRQGIKGALENHLLRIINIAESKKDSFEKKDWLPWRIIKETDSRLSRKSKQEIEDFYGDIFIERGYGSLMWLDNISEEVVEKTISQIFDPAFYKTAHEDMGELSFEDCLSHYSVHGGKESTRQPNQYFRNSEFLDMHPWVKALNINVLYLFASWPEQFSDYAEVIKQRIMSKDYLISSGEKQRLFATTRALGDQIDDYERILYLTNEYSSEKRRVFNRKSGILDIHLVIPDFTKGGGGHMTIFRMVKYLENEGHKITIWVKGYNYENHRKGAKHTAQRYYQPINAEVLPLSTHFAMANGDALIATSWDTVEIVMKNKSFHEKFYLVQDFEPLFYARGSKAVQAEWTYQQEIKTICASEWLNKIMTEKYSRISTGFQLSFNPKIYFKEEDSLNRKERDDRVVNIAMYARIRTERRAVELAIEGLNCISKSNKTIIINIFGDTPGTISLPSSVVGIDHGILTPEQLGELYRKCDIGLTFSTTNYALVPQEMMACGLAVIEIDNESTNTIYPSGVAELAKPDPLCIANSIQKLVNDKKTRTIQSQKAYEWVKQASWDSSFKKVNDFLTEETKRAKERGNGVTNMAERYKELPHKFIRTRTKELNPLVSVIIPTFNGGKLLREVVNKVISQRTSFEYELIIIDSESTDSCCDGLSKSDIISVVSIPKHTFQHGRTRNLGVALSKGKYVAFLTQDAIPANNQWLTELVKPLIRHNNMAGVFGAHKGHEYHPNWIKEEIDVHFKTFRDDLIITMDRDLDAYQTAKEYRQYCHYYSDNNSCLKKNVWETTPYPDVEYGEDQLWADIIIQLGYSKGYAKKAIVRHSHDYDLDEEYERHMIESYFFEKFFGYKMAQNRLEIETYMEKDCSKYVDLKSDSKNKDVANEHKMKRVRAKKEGYLAGHKKLIKEITSFKRPVGKEE